MSTPKPPKRRRYLFPRSLEEVVKQATKPLMDKQGKLYSALLRDWEKIVGPERAAVTRPQRLQFPATEVSGATLHLQVRPAAAPEISYITGQILEQCARYFGYKAIERIVIHATHGVFNTAPEIPVVKPAMLAKAIPIPSDTAPEIRDILARIGAHVGSGIVKKD